MVNPWSFSQARSCTSCVLPSCGVPTRLPRKSEACVMPDAGRTTSADPPLAAPAKIRGSAPADFAYAFKTGLGPL